MDSRTTRLAEFAVDGWLNVATDHLCAEARERVTVEVTAHFMDAIDVEIEAGMAPEEAVECAQAALGDPWKARRALKKVYLTDAEDKRLKGMQKRPSEQCKRWVVQGLLFIFFITLFEFILPGSEHPKNVDWGDATVAVFVVVLTICVFFMMNPYLCFRWFRPRAAFALATAVYATFWGLMVLGLPHFGWWFFGSLNGVIAYDLLKLFRIWRKLDRTKAGTCSPDDSSPV